FRSDKKNIRNVSLNSLVGYDKDGNEIAFIDIIKTPHPDYVEAIHTKNNINLLKKYMQALNEREKNIITKRYGLDNQDELTQKQIAQELNISRSYVSRIEKRALTKILKEFIKSKNYSYFE
ncbi:MAG: sigma-70 family RNA polymerase sigma factor, partial [Bacilli bacterium]